MLPTVRQIDLPSYFGNSNFYASYGQTNRFTIVFWKFKFLCFLRSDKSIYHRILEIQIFMLPTVRQIDLPSYFGNSNFYASYGQTNRFTIVFWKFKFLCFLRSDKSIYHRILEIQIFMLPTVRQIDLPSYFGNSNFYASYGQTNRFTIVFWKFKFLCFLRSDKSIYHRILEIQIFMLPTVRQIDLPSYFGNSNFYASYGQTNRFTIVFWKFKFLCFLRSDKSIYHRILEIQIFMLPTVRQIDLPSYFGNSNFYASYGQTNRFTIVFWKFKFLCFLRSDKSIYHRILEIQIFMLPTVRQIDLPSYFGNSNFYASYGQTNRFTIVFWKFKFLCFLRSDKSIYHRILEIQIFMLPTVRQIDLP